jgi:putative transposase
MIPDGIVNGVDVTVRYNYRLRPSRTTAAALEQEGRRATWVWNQCVRRSRELFNEHIPCGPALLDHELTDWRNTDQQWSRWLAEGSSVVQQQAIRDFAAARAKALKDIKARLPVKQRRGLPRFRSVRNGNWQPSMNYTLRGFTVTDRRLRLAGGLSVPVVWSRELPSAPKSVRVFRDNVGHWWASFVVTVTQEALPVNDQAIGIDWGVTDTAVTTDAAYDLPHRRRGKTAARQLANLQRRQARRRPAKGQRASNGYREAKHQTARLYQKIAWQRADDAHKWAHKVVNDHHRIAVEDFKPKFLARTTMAYSAADGAIGQTKRILIEHARRAGRDLQLVDPAYTTMDCGVCGARAKHRLPLSERIYTCETCGTVESRDRNAAQVVLNRAGFNPASADRVRPETPRGTQAA